MPLQPLSIVECADLGLWKVTMFCYRCNIDFLRGTTSCSQCGAMLVYRFPERRAVPDSRNEADTETDGKTEALFSVLRTFHSVVDAHLARAILASAGIQSLLRSNDDAAVVLPHLSWISGIQVLVPLENLDEAEEILNADASGM
jgi:Putative prokaryotic signal transducing protein